RDRLTNQPGSGFRHVRGLYDPARGGIGAHTYNADRAGWGFANRVGHLAPHSASAPQDNSQAGAQAWPDDRQARSRVPARVQAEAALAASAVPARALLIAFLRTPENPADGRQDQ